SMQTRFRIEMTLFAYYFARTLLLSYAVWDRKATSLWRYDYFWRFIVESNNAMYNELFVLQFVALGVFSFVLLYGLYDVSKPGKITLRKFYIYMVLNVDAYYKAMKPKTQQKLIQDKYANELFQSKFQNTRLGKSSHLVSAVL